MVQFPIPLTELLELSPMVTSPLISSDIEYSTLYPVMCQDDPLSITHALFDISFDNAEYNTRFLGS